MADQRQPGNNFPFFVRRIFRWLTVSTIAPAVRGIQRNWNPHPRVVDWLLLATVLFEVLSGLVTFLIGKPEGAWYWTLHSIVGLTLVISLIWKLNRVASRSIPRKGRWSNALSIIVAVFAVLVVVTGVVWVSYQVPFGYPTGLNLHVVAALTLLVLITIHTLMRNKPVSRSQVLSRRNFIAGLGAGVVASSAWLGQRAAGTSFNWPGAHRRFTGSREVTGPLPVTIWMFDQIPVIELANFSLAVTGAINQPVKLNIEDLQTAEQSILTATLDCTGGWFKEEVWTGIPVSSLLADARVNDDAKFVSFRSVTGYRWSLSLAEAQNALLALDVGGVPLSAGNGGPLRLVAPGHRGFQWVKWVEEIRVLNRADPGQWGAIFTSGLDRKA